MARESLQEAIDRAGSPVRLLWKRDPPGWQPDLPAEFVGWEVEQTAAYETVALSDQSRHIDNYYVEGPDALKLLKDVFVNNFDSFVVGQAKQAVAVNSAGQFIGDGILTREREDRFNLNAIPYSASWLRYIGERGGYDVELSHTPPVAWSNENARPESLFRYEIQGPRALELVEAVFGAPIPETKFFHSTEVELDGRRFHALRHGMTGQPGYEFIGPWEHADAVKAAFLQTGEPLGLIQVGARAYSLNGIESGWIPMPTGAIYDSDDLRAYREWLSADSFEGRLPLGGSYFSPDIADYYCSPYELGYGRLIAFNHDFIGRTALEQLEHQPARQKVTLVIDQTDAAQTFGTPIRFTHSYGRYRVEADGCLVGVAYYTGSIAHASTVMALALVDPEHVSPGTRVTLVWGAHPGFDEDPRSDLGFVHLAATVEPSPYNRYARETYRAN